VALGEVIEISKVVGSSSPRFTNDFRANTASSALFPASVASFNPGELALTLQLQVSYLIK
jgi:hypothetical protein